MYNFDVLADRKNDNSRKWNVNLIKEKYVIKTDDYLPMWIADMDFESPDFVTNRFLDIIEKKSFCYTYSYDSFYNSVINWYKNYKKISIEKEWITLSYGTVSTMHYVVQSFSKPGDRVAFLSPVYDPFRYSVENNNRSCVSIPLMISKDRYYIDFELLKKEINDPKVKILLFCNPHNPSSRVWSMDEIRKVSEICKETGTLLVSDEVHSDIIFVDEFHSCLKLDKTLISNLIILSSPNKSFNLGGLKTSYSIIPNEGIRLQFKEQLSRNAITSPNVFGIAGIVASYDLGKGWLKEVTEYIYSNYILLKNQLLDVTDKIDYMPLESSYLLWIDISEFQMKSEEFVRKFALEEGVIVEPGTNFGEYGEGYIRVNLGTSKKIINEFMNRFKSFISIL